MVRNSDREVTSEAKRKEPKPVVSMVPLFSWRSIIVVAIGVIVGVGLGLCYWMISPSLNSPTQSDTTLESDGSTGSFGPLTTGPWRSDVTIQVVNPGPHRAEYYVAKANSLPYLVFLSQELAKQEPRYRHTIDELSQMISTEYDNLSLTRVYNFKTIVTTPTVEETTFLITHIPEVFKSYLIAEEINKRQEEYRDTLKAIETVKTAILEAEQKLSALTPQGIENDINNNPTKVALNSKIKALESELDRHAAELSVLIATRNVTEYKNIEQEKYQKTLQQVVTISAALAKAEQELQALELKKRDISKDATAIMLNTKINALQAEINKLMTGWVDIKADGRRINKIGLAELIANGDNSSSVYKDRLATVQRASTALAEAKKELAILENQASDARLAEDLDYQLAQTKVENLNKELASVNEKLDTLLISDIGISEVISDYFIVETPDIPMPVLPVRLSTALMMGAIIGIAGAWVLLNYRWIAKGMPSSSTAKPDEDEEE